MSDLEQKINGDISIKTSQADSIKVESPQTDNVKVEFQPSESVKNETIQVDANIKEENKETKIKVTADKKPITKDEKKSYKEEKNAKKAAKALANYQKSTSYKEGYKNKGKDISRDNGGEYRSRDNARNNTGGDYRSRDNAALSAKRFELCNGMVVFLKEKIENKKLEVTPFELLFMDGFFKEFTAKPIIKLHGTANSDDTNNAINTCNNGDNCVVWYCKFLHPNNRKNECKCENPNCPNLHKHQSLCRNPHHRDDCDMAHKMDELANIEILKKMNNLKIQ